MITMPSQAKPRSRPASAVKKRGGNISTSRSASAVGPRGSSSSGTNGRNAVAPRRRPARATPVKSARSHGVSQRGGGTSAADDALESAFSNKMNDDAGRRTSAPVDGAIEYALKARSNPAVDSTKSEKNSDRRAWSDVSRRDLRRADRDVQDPVLRQSQPYGEAVRQNDVVSKMQSDMAAMVKSIQEAVRRTIGNIDSARKVSEVNERLVDFANESMTIVVRLSENLYTVISHMKELNAELDALNRQLVDSPLAAQVGRLDEKIQRNMKDLRTQFETAVKKVSPYAGPELSNIVGRAVQNMQQVIEQSNSLQAAMVASAK